MNKHSSSNPVIRVDGYSHAHTTQPESGMTSADSSMVIEYSDTDYSFQSSFDEDRSMFSASAPSSRSVFLHQHQNSSSFARQKSQNQAPLGAVYPGQRGGDASPAMAVEQTHSGPHHSFGGHQQFNNHHHHHQQQHHHHHYHNNTHNKHLTSHGSSFANQYNSGGGHYDGSAGQEQIHHQQQASSFSGASTSKSNSWFGWPSPKVDAQSGMRGVYGSNSVFLFPSNSGSSTSPSTASSSKQPNFKINTAAAIAQNNSFQYDRKSSSSTPKNPYSPFPSSPPLCGVAGIPTSYASFVSKQNGGGASSGGSSPTVYDMGYALPRLDLSPVRVSCSSRWRRMPKDAWECLSEYLTCIDIKSVRLVCRSWSSAVWNHREIRRRLDCGEDAHLLYVHTLEAEVRHIPKSDFRVVQPEVPPHVRAKVVHWMTDVSLSFRHHIHTQFVAIRLFDRVLGCRAVPCNEVQLVAMACILLAAKAEEANYPSLDSLVEMSRNIYSRRQIVLMESAVFAIAEFSCHPPTVISSLQYFLKECPLPAGGVSLSFFLSEQSLLDERIPRVAQGKLATALYYIAAFVCDVDPWQVLKLSTFSAWDLKSELLLLIDVWANSFTSRFQAIREAYCDDHHSGVGMMHPSSDLQNHILSL